MRLIHRAMPSQPSRFQRDSRGKLKNLFFEKFGITVAGGQDQAKGKIIRIAIWDIMSDGHGDGHLSPGDAFEGHGL